MPFLLLRDESSASLSALVENARKKIFPLQEYDLQLNNGELELISLGKPFRKTNSTSTDEGFESDIDTSSIVSSDNDSFHTEKVTKNDRKPNENDSANGSDTEAPESGNFEKNQEETDNSLLILPCSKQNIEKFNLVECMCYTDIKCNDILIFVIKKETFVFKFHDMNDLRNFYSKFTALKAVANQKNYDGKLGHSFTPVQKTGTHYLFKKKTEYPFSIRADSKFMSISNPLDVTREYNEKKYPKQKESMSDIKYSTLGTNLGMSNKTHMKSSSIVDSLGLDVRPSNLVRESNLKVWNSAEDILDPPKRPQRKKKRRAPEPPELLNENQDIMSGQYVRVNVNLDCVDSSLKSSVPKKNFSSIFSTKTSIKSLLKPKEKELLRYEPRVGDFYNMNRNSKTLNRSWTSSKFVDKSKSKPEFQKFVPVDYRYVDNSKNNNHLAIHTTQKGVVRAIYPGMGQNLALSKTLRGEAPVPSFNTRLFGLSSKLKDYSNRDGTQKSFWGNKKEMTLKSVIKGNKEEASKKKNDKKVTFSCYTTVQVV